MFKIEQSLLIKKPNVELSLMSIIEEYYKEMHMLISNIHLTHVIMKDNVGKVFPLETNKYDGSWYKNLLVSSNIIFDRFHMVIDPSINYDEIFKDETKCDFKALANLWNKINFIVKYNLTSSEWDEKVKSWNVIATSKKIEELLANGVKINQPLLEAIDFDVEKYKSVPKAIDETRDFEFNNLVRVLKGEPKEEKIEVASTLAELEKEKAEEKKVEQVIAQPAVHKEQQIVQANTVAQPQPNLEIKTTPKIEKGPISPVKKEMDQLIRWISIREADIKTFKTKMRLGYDPEELKLINSQLDVIAKEVIFNDELISEAKKLIPPHEQKGEMDALLRWINEKSAAIKKYKKLLSGASLIDDEKRLNKAIDNVSEEIKNVDLLISEARKYLPKDPLLKELNALTRWIDLRQKDIRDHKRKLSKEENINDELKLIEKEMAIVDNKIDSISREIVVLNKNKPVDPAKHEMDEILKWVKQKEKILVEAKRELNKQAREMQEYKRQEKEIQRKLEEARNQLLKTQNEINEVQSMKARELKSLDEIKLEQKKVLDDANKKPVNDIIADITRSEFAKMYLDEIDDNQEDEKTNDLMIVKKPLPSFDPKQAKRDLQNQQSSKVEKPSMPPMVISTKKDTNSNNKYDLAKPINNEPSLNDKKRNKELNSALIVSKKPSKKSIENNLAMRDFSEHELNELESEMKEIKFRYEKINKEYKEALEKYRIEVKILETAFEVLPKSLREIASNNLPGMIDHLLDEGYIRKNKDDNKLGKKQKVLKN